MRLDSPAVTQQQFWVPSWNLKRSLTLFTQFQWFPKIPVETWEEHCVLHLILRWGPISLLWLERSPDFPLAPQEEACFTYCNSRGAPRFLLKVERTQSSPSVQDKAWFPCSDSDGTLSFPSQHEGRSNSPVAPLEIGEIPASTRQEWHPFYTREESRVTWLIKRWGLTPLLKLNRNHRVPCCKGEEPWVSLLNSSWGPIPLQWLERNPKVPLASQKEAWLLWGNMKFPEVFLSTLEEPQASCHNLR